ncbi:hypothetical protein EUX98_g6732 [Antrodiella citrinella]|uniref:Uncharacterized protein n=1 Tax=Antrodiella citrinella TaxID=2447956 RepID=A0A4S4MNE9_9APHY|nr:hypothetical protein EUX98_g6732 [Antrodiella citrinella]
MSTTGQQSLGSSESTDSSGAKVEGIYPVRLAVDSKLANVDTTTEALQAPALCNVAIHSQRHKAEHAADNIDINKLGTGDATNVHAICVRDEDRDNKEGCSAVAGRIKSASGVVTYDSSGPETTSAGSEALSVNDDARPFPQIPLLASHLYMPHPHVNNTNHTVDSLPPVVIYTQPAIRAVNAADSFISRFVPVPPSDIARWQLANEMRLYPATFGNVTFNHEHPEDDEGEDVDSGSDCSGADLATSTPSSSDESDSEQSQEIDFVSLAFVIAQAAASLGRKVEDGAPKSTPSEVGFLRTRTDLPPPPANVYASPVLPPAGNLDSAAAAADALLLLSLRPVVMVDATFEDYCLRTGAMLSTTAVVTADEEDDSGSDSEEGEECGYLADAESDEDEL